MKTKKLAIILLTAILFFPAKGLIAGQYNVKNIDPELLEDATVVIREDITVFEVLRRNRSRVKHRLVKTIMESKGRQEANLRIIYDPYREVNDLKGVVYDEYGQKIRELTKDEFEDKSYSEGFSVYQDNRVIETDIYPNQYPVTIEYEYTIDISIVFINNLFRPVRRSEVSLENASYTIITPKDHSFRYIAYNNDDLKPAITSNENNNLEYKWVLQQIPAVKNEPYMPSVGRIVPFVQFGSNDFVYDGYSGNMQTWENFGKWIGELNENKQNLPRRTVNEVIELTENLEDTLDIIRTIYEYMQSKTRYVSIQLGIGGMKPDDARSVVRNGYGDCKALSNFMKALLESVGIKSYYTIISSGSSGLNVNPEFPFNYFNHVILCVPLGSDSIWLETTSSILPSGYIGTSNSNRYALLVTENGGKLARTPGYNQSSNVIRQSIIANANDSQNAIVTLEKSFNGLAAERRFGLSQVSDSRKEDIFVSIAGLNNIEVNEIEYYKHYDKPIYVNKTVEFLINNHFRRAGNRLFFQPVILSGSHTVPSTSEERVNDFQINDHYVYNDTIKWKLPENYKIEHLPESIEQSKTFGFYELKYEYNEKDNLLVINRIFCKKAGLYSSDNYPEFLEFLRLVNQSDQSNIMLVPR